MSGSDHDDQKQGPARVVNWFAAAALAFVVAILVTGCGGITDSDREFVDQKINQAREALDQAQDDAATLIADATKCERMVAPLVKKLKGLDSILNTVGLNYASYGERVNGIVVSYGDIRAGQLGLDCLNPGGKAERAVRAYVEGHGIWQECFEDLYCDNDSIEDELQGKWLIASDNVDRANRLLTSLRRKARQSRESIEQAEQTLGFAEKYQEQIEAGEKGLVEADRAMQEAASEWAAERGAEFEGVTVERSITDGEDGTVEFSNGEVVTLKPEGDGWRIDAHDAGLTFGLYE